MRAALDTTFDNKDPYKILGVTADTAPAAIRKAFLGLAKRYHPDLLATDSEKYRSTTEVMQYINAAYELLADPARRQLWDRKHSVAPRPAPRVAPRPAHDESRYYDSELAHVVIRRYNAFVSSLSTPAARKRAARRIQRFQASSAGSAYIKELVARHYREVMDLLILDSLITVFDDGLVEMMCLYKGTLEVAPSSVFVTYAWLVFNDNKGKFPAELGGGRPARGSAGGDVRLRVPDTSTRPTRKRSKPGRNLGAQVWKWLMEKPGPRR
jgi:hypothetical protein